MPHIIAAICDKLIKDMKNRMVGAERFELPTLWSQTRCATRLRHAPTPYQYIHVIHREVKRRNNNLIADKYVG